MVPWRLHLPRWRNVRDDVRLWTEALFWFGGLASLSVPPAWAYSQFFGLLGVQVELSGPWTAFLVIAAGVALRWKGPVDPARLREAKQRERRRYAPGEWPLPGDEQHWEEDRRIIKQDERYEEGKAFLILGTVLLILLPWMHSC